MECEGGNGVTGQSSRRTLGDPRREEADEVREGAEGRRDTATDDSVATEIGFRRIIVDGVLKTSAAAHLPLRHLGLEFVLAAMVAGRIGLVGFAEQSFLRRWGWGPWDFALWVLLPFGVYLCALLFATFRYPALVQRIWYVQVVFTSLLVAAAMAGADHRGSVGLALCVPVFLTAEYSHPLDRAGARVLAATAANLALYVLTTWPAYQRVMAANPDNPDYQAGAFISKIVMALTVAGLILLYHRRRHVLLDHVERVLNRLSVGIAIVSEDCTICYASAKSKDAIGAENCVGRRLHDLVSFAGGDSGLCPVCGAVRQQRHAAPLGGAPGGRVLKCAVHPVHVGTSGLFVGLLGITDVTDVETEHLGKIEAARRGWQAATWSIGHEPVKRLQMLELDIQLLRQPVFGLPREAVDLLDRMDSDIAAVFEEVRRSADPVLSIPPVVGEIFDVCQAVEAGTRIAEAEMVGGDRRVEREYGLPEGARARGSAQFTTDIVRELVRNAGKYSPEGSPILVRIRQAREAGTDCICVDVLQGGPKIPPKERAWVFEPFHTALPAHLGVAARTELDKPGARRGLGLAIAKRKAFLQTGDLVYSANATKRLHGFVLWLPAASAKET